MNTDIKKMARVFLDTHRDIDVSAAKLLYSHVLYHEQGDKLISRISKPSLSPEEITQERAILSTDDPDVLLQFMRKPMPFANQTLLRKRLLENEDRMLPLIQQRALRSLQDMFIERAALFFIFCTENPSDWIMEHYQDFRCEYAKSIFSLVLGFRGIADWIPFLILESERMERQYPQEAYDQGPMLAVQELAVRFLNSNP